MRIYLVVDETSFFIPNFVADFVRACPYSIVGAAVVTHVPAANSVRHYLKSHARHLTSAEIVRLLADEALARVKSSFSSRAGSGVFYSVRSVLDFFGVSRIEVHDNINRDEYLTAIRSANPDVILSSNSLIFRKELLGIPSICCINRHSSLLPSYGGLWPVFQAMRRGERQSGVSVHVMEEGIDAGVVLSRKVIPIGQDDTVYQMYDKCYGASAEVCLAALAKVGAGDFSPCDELFDRSYYSWPTAEHWAEFRSRGRRFV